MSRTKKVDATQGSLIPLIISFVLPLILMTLIQKLFNAVDIAVLALPAFCAQEVAASLYEHGIRGFWNFAPVDLKLPEDAALVNVHLDEGLQVLSYRMLHNHM